MCLVTGLQSPSQFIYYYKSFPTSNKGQFTRKPHLLVFLHSTEVRLLQVPGKKKKVICHNWKNSLGSAGSEVQCVVTPGKDKYTPLIFGPVWLDVLFLGKTQSVAHRRVLTRGINKMDSTTGRWRNNRIQSPIDPPRLPPPTIIICLKKPANHQRSVAGVTKLRPAIGAHTSSSCLQ